MDIYQFLLGYLSILVIFYWIYRYFNLRHNEEVNSYIATKKELMDKVKDIDANLAAHLLYNHGAKVSRGKK